MSTRPLVIFKGVRVGGPMFVPKTVTISPGAMADGAKLAAFTTATGDGRPAETTKDTSISWGLLDAAGEDTRTRPL